MGYHHPVIVLERLLTVVPLAAAALVNIGLTVGAFQWTNDQVSLVMLGVGTWFITAVAALVLWRIVRSKRLHATEVGT